MSIVTKNARAHMDANHAMYYPKISGLIAGEDLPLVSAVKIGTDGKVYLAADGDDFAGFTLDDKKAGEPATIHGIGSIFQYTAGGLTPGQKLYLPAAANKGLLDNAVVTAGVRPVAQAISAKLIRIVAAI